MKKKQIKLMVKNMSDEELIKEASEQYALSSDESNVGNLGWALLFTGGLFCFTIIVPLIFFPLGLLMILAKPRKHTKIKKIMFKELRKRGYKIVEKIGYGINNCGVQFIKNKY